MTNARTWHKGPPPHVGWWNASAFQDPDAWRWWNGIEWSGAAWTFMTAERAASATSAKCNEIKPIKWTDYWPENARVPRVDPRQPIAYQAPADEVERMIRASADMLINVAASYGMNVTIERVPMKPLAMGNTASVVTVWPKRGAV